MTGSVFTKPYTSAHNIVSLLYAVVFLLPFTHLFYVPLVIALLLALWRVREHGKQELRIGSLRQAGAAFLLCSFLSVINSPDKLFSLFNWCFLPLMYAVLYILIVTYADSRDIRKNLMLSFFAGAVLVMVYGIWQYTHIVDMATDMAAHDWVDASRFPMLYRRFYSTLENPNLCATYLLMMTSYSGAFFLFEKRRRQKGLLLLLTMGLVVCLALTYSRGAWISLLFILAVYGLEYDKRLFALLLLVPVILFFYQGQVAVRFLSLFSAQDTSIGMRFTMWRNTLGMISDHPLLGCGWGAYYLVYPDYDLLIRRAGVTIFHAHNMYLSVMANVGIPGAIAYFWFYFGHIRYAWRVYRKSQDTFYKAIGLGTIAAITAVAVNGIGDYTLFSIAVSMCFWALMAIGMSSYEDRLETDNR